MEKKNDEFYMRRAMELAKSGCGWVNPNPMVGAVVEKDGRIIGEGFHEKYGEMHAERNALKHCIEDSKGATMYVTLEPCCHYGKQPPCTEAIIQSGIKRVIIGSDDPNPRVAGKGIRELKKHGIEVSCGFMKKECDELNPIFFYYMKTGLPFVTMKYAMTLDGKTATFSGKSKWITSELARNHVHKQRHRHMAIMTGIGTVLTDDPSLTCRIDIGQQHGKTPVRIICDTHLRIPLDSRIVGTAKRIPTIIACEDNKNYEKKASLLKELGCKIICPGMDGDHLNLRNLVRMLGNGEEVSMGKIDSIYLEGGQTLNWSAMQNGIVNSVNAYIAPKIFGGRSALSPLGGIGIENPSEAFVLKNTHIMQLGCDYMIEGEICLQES